MSYRNPKQYLDPTGSPIAEGLSQGFKLWEENIEKDRLEQQKIIEQEDADSRARANNILKLPGSNNPQLQKELMQIMRNETIQLQDLQRELNALTGQDRNENLFKQEEIKANVAKYGEYVTTLSFLENKFIESVGKNPEDEGYISKATGAGVQKIISGYKNKDPRVHIKQENGETFLTMEGVDFKLNLQNATSTLAAGNEVIKTISPIKSFQETAGKTILNPGIATWKETISTKIPLKDGSSRVIAEEKINLEKARQELMNNGSFNWVADKTNYELANQTWIDRMGENTIFDNNNPEQVMAVKKWLIEDTLKNVVPQSKIISDTIKAAATKTPSQENQAKLNSWWKKNGGDLNSKLNKAMGSGKINMKNAETVFQNYGFDVKQADIEVDGKRILNSYTITNNSYGKGWKIRIEADDSPSQAMAKIAGQFTGDMQQVAPKQSLPKLK
jgi:hypothetical protein